MKLLLYIVFQLSCCLVNCQYLEWNGTKINNNSVIYYGDISKGSTAVKCYTDNDNCCSPNTGNWLNERGKIVHEGANGASCLYFTRGDHVISLNRRNSYCIPPLSGLWRCDIPDSSGELQSLFIYIGTSTTSGQLSRAVPINVGVQTEPRVSPPEFIISCRTHGGPATEVSWLKHITLVEGSQYNISVYIIQTSQTILDTSFISVYDNKLFVRGRAGGEFSCSVRNNFPLITRTNKTIITVAGEPTNFTAVTSSSNNTHVNVTVSWESPADTVTTGYVIYYQPKTGGPVISESVTGGHRESHSLTGLQRGHTYNISIVALSQHLPSPLVGPVNVATDPLLVVETSPQSLNVTSNQPFSLTCTVRAEFEPNPINAIIKWIRITPSNSKIEAVVSPVLPESQYGSGYSSPLDKFLTPAVLEHHVAEGVIESGAFIYRCVAKALNTTSFSDTTVFVEVVADRASSLKATTYSNTINDVISSFIISTPTPTAEPVTLIPSHCANRTLSADSLPTSNFVAVTAGGVGGALLLIIVIEFIAILLLWTCRRRGRESVKTETNTAYGVVSRREEPEYEVIGLRRCHA